MLGGHDEPQNLAEWMALFDCPESSVWRMMERAGADVMLFGHTHKPYHRIVRDESGDGARHAINIGSIGKAKDGDPRACWALLEVDEPQSSSTKAVDVEFVHVAYDVETAARGIEDSPLPDPFAEMLRTGKSNPD